MGTLSRCYVNTAVGHAWLTSPLYSSTWLCGHQPCTRKHLARCVWCHPAGTLFYGVQHSCPDLLLVVVILLGIHPNQIIINYHVLIQDPISGINIQGEDILGFIPPEISTLHDNNYDYIEFWRAYTPLHSKQSMCYKTVVRNKHTVLLGVVDRCGRHNRKIVYTCSSRGKYLVVKSREKAVFLRLRLLITPIDHLDAWIFWSGDFYVNRWQTTD